MPRISAVIRAMRRAINFCLLVDGFIRSLPSLLISSRPMTLPMRMVKAVAILARLTAWKFSAQLNLDRAIKKTTVFVKFKNTTKVCAGEKLWSRRRIWIAVMAKKIQRREGGKPAASCQPLLPGPANDSQLKIPRVIWAMRRKRKMFFRPVLVFLSCFSASVRARGEIIKTAMRMRLYVPTVLFELEGIKSRLDLSRVFAPGGVGSVAFD